MSTTASSGPAVKKKSRQPAANRPSAPPRPRGISGSNSHGASTPVAQPRMAAYGATVGSRPDVVSLLSLSADSIEVGPQFRKNFDPIKLEEMAASILARGVVNAVIVHKHDIIPGKYALIAGERRVRAVRLLLEQGHNIRIPAVVRPKAEKYLLQHDENEHREDLSLIERAGELEWFKHHDAISGEPLTKPLSNVKLAKLLHMDRPTVHQIMSYAEWVPEVLSLAESQKITSPRILTKLNSFFAAGDSDTVSPEGAEIMLKLGNQLAHQADTAEPMTRDAMIALYNGMETLLADNDLDKAKALSNEVDGLTTLPDVRAAVHLFVPPKGTGTNATRESSDSSVTRGAGEGVASATISRADSSESLPGQVDADPAIDWDEDRESTRDLEPLKAEPWVPTVTPNQSPAAKQISSGTALGDVLKQSRVRREGGGEGWIASVTVRWDDGTTEEVEDLRSLLIDDSQQGRT